MFPTQSELQEKISLGEDGLLELKEVRFAGGRIRGPDQQTLADEIAAFANAQGGVLVLGVDDARDIVGIPIEHLDAVESLTRQACEDSITPTVAPLIQRITLTDSTGIKKAILRVDVNRSLSVHQSPSGYFHRVGSSKRPMPPDHLARLLQHRSQSRLIRFDETPVPGAGLETLDEDLWRRFITERTLDAPEHLLAKLAMVATDQDGVVRPTVVGILLGSLEPQHYIPGAFIQAVAYIGSDISPKTEGAYQRDARDITGPLDKQIRDACDFVRSNMQVAATKDTAGGRIDVPQFDMLAVFEAVTNAVAHRDYAMTGSKVRLRLFDDRLELYSPGMLPNTMTTDSLQYRQAARNEAITSMLAKCPVSADAVAGHRTHIMDKRGEGVPIILSRSKELSGQSPEYQMIDDSELLLTIHAAEVD